MLIDITTMNSVSVDDPRRTTQSSEEATSSFNELMVEPCFRASRCDNMFPVYAFAKTMAHKLHAAINQVMKNVARFRCLPIPDPITNFSNNTFDSFQVNYFDRVEV